MTDKFNRLTESSPLKQADSISPNSESEIIGTAFEDPGDRDVDTAFLQAMTQAEVLESIYLGAGPHEKGRTSLRILDPYPTRTSTSNPETFFDKTFEVRWDPAWNGNDVWLQAEPGQFAIPTTAMSVATTVLVNVNGGADNTFTPTGSYRVGLGDFTTAGEYSVRIRLKGTTTVGCPSGLYLVGVAPREGVWCGVPTVDASGIISYDMTIQMPDKAGVDDWEVEIAEA